jgi:galactokinase
VALVEARHAAHVAREVQRHYRERSGRSGACFVAHAVDGAA